MIASHPDVAFLPESSILRRLLISGRLRKKMDREGVEGAMRLLGTDERFGRIGVPAVELFNGEGTSAAEIYRKLLLAYAARLGRYWVGDKDPRLVEYLPLVRQALPDARVIHIIRDPRDILASKKQAEWSKSRSTIAHILAGKMQLNLGRRDGPRAFNENYYELSYERLIQNPQEELLKVCSAIGLDYHPAMLEFGAAAKQLVSEAEVSWKKETLGPVLAANTGKWRDKLEPWEVAVVERLFRGGERSGRYRFEKTTVELTFSQKLRTIFVVLMVSVLEPVYLVFRMCRLWVARRRLG
jgi:hypothetical protein